jgi:outer membrane protein assembly factor BamE (lipoprotein component of BamABCDE complex)
MRVLAQSCLERPASRGPRRLPIIKETSMHAVKAFNVVAVAAALAAAAVPALAATDDASPAAKWWLKVVPTPQRVTTDVIEQIHPGMDEGDVKALIGAPNRTGYFPLSHTTTWDYAYRDAWGYNATFSTIFNDDHIVVSKVSVRKTY